jgi:NADP-dependent 3-hydroxy acid dehydrogenase YdfG
VRFKDRSVVVTGGSQGIGAAIAEGFAAEGAEVAVVASAERTKAQGVVDRIMDAGGSARAFVCDVARTSEIEVLIADVLAVFGRIDVLVNCAGVFYPTRIGETDQAMFDRMCDINLRGTFFTCNAVAPHMIARGSGKIINIGSTAASIGRGDYIVYSATKAGVEHMKDAPKFKDSAGLLVKLQLAARDLDPTSKVPLKLYGQELTAESYAVAQMNTIIHDMSVEMARGDTMINPKFKTADSKIRTYDIVVANPMWNQPFNPDVFADDPFDRFRTQGGATTGKGDWAWLQHTLACMNDRGRAAVVLDTGAVTRGSGSKNEDRERNIRKWFVDRDLIDGVILLPDNLFYNTSASGVIVVLSRRKPAARKDKIVLLNASRRVQKGRPKNFIPEDDIRPLAAAYLKGEPVEGEIAVITKEQAQESDYNLSPSRWVGHSEEIDHGSISDLLRELSRLHDQDVALTSDVMKVLAPMVEEPADG